jgi:hypothetical protein
MSPERLEDGVADKTQTDKSMPALVAELWELVVSYFKQETIAPLKSLQRFILLGLAGSVLLATGLVLLAMSALRALQQETSPHWQGNWSWAPYGITTAGSLVVILLLAHRIGAERRRARKTGAHSARKGA